MISKLDPVTVEVIKNSLIYASEEMGIAVRNSAYSPNIKERLDHSCALFDRDARLIAQAEHIPVHLGSLPWGLRRTVEVIVAEAGANVTQLLHRAHHEAYGYAMPEERVLIVTLRVVAQGEPILSRPPDGWDQGQAAPERSREIGIAEGTVTERVVSRAGLAAGDEGRGPALIEQPDTTTLLATEEVATVDDAGNLVVQLHG